MAFKPNYNHQRAERDRAKQAKKETKLRERAEAAARRKSGVAEEGSAEEGVAEQRAVEEGGAGEEENVVEPQAPTHS